MRKKLALLLAAIMVIGMIPMTAFATTTNRISNVVTGQEDDQLTDNAPILRMYEKDLDSTDVATKQAFQLDLTNAEWILDTADDKTDCSKAALEAAIIAQSSCVDDATITKLTAKSIVVEVMLNKQTASAAQTGKCTINVPMWVELTDNGDATVTIDPMDSVISAGTYKFATVADGATTITVEGRRDVSENGRNLKIITIKETTPGVIEGGKTKDETIKLKLSNDWSFYDPADSDNAVVEPVNLSVYPSEYADDIYFSGVSADGQEAYITVKAGFKSETAMTIAINAYVLYDEDEVEPGDICDLTVSGAGTDKTTLEVARAVTYGVTWVAEDKDLPVIYSGSMDEDDNETLEVTLSETVASSWLTNRKTKVVFPEGVKVIGVEASDEDSVVINGYKLNDDCNELTINATTSGKCEVTFKFVVSVAPSFTGDITATLTGSGVDEEISAVVATAVAPVTVEAEKTDIVLDYRHTTIGDITITEAEAGLLEKGKTLGVKIENLSFDDDPTVEVVSGDLKIDDVTVDNGVIYIDIDGASAKEPAVIKISNVELYMTRDIPAGAYALKLTATDQFTQDETNDIEATWDTTGADVSFNLDAVHESNDAIFKNSIESGVDETGAPLFDSRNVTVYKDYVNVVTAGRDVDDNTFTTTLKVTIGATEMYANDKAIALDVPAYIANGYTMLPVRAVTEALSGTAIVRWDDATKTVTITFGARVINMTVGSNVMVINGVEVPMQAKCEITDSRAFIPLRDMGYALGLNDSKIQWDDATKTATLN